MSFPNRSESVKGWKIPAEGHHHLNRDDIAKVFKLLEEKLDVKFQNIPRLIDIAETKHNMINGNEQMMKFSIGVDRQAADRPPEQLEKIAHSAALVMTYKERTIEAAGYIHKEETIVLRRHMGNER